MKLAFKIESGVRSLLVETVTYELACLIKIKKNGLVKVTAYPHADSSS